ncbi:MAG: hypothetical protein RL685_1465 [Pseudomonadota bacterium]
MSVPELGGEQLGLCSLRSEGAAPLEPLARLLRLVKLERDDLWVVLIYGAATGLVSLAVPIAAQSLVNTVAFTALLQPLVVLAALVLLGSSLAGLASTIQHTMIERLHQRFFVRTVHDVGRRLLEADVASLPGRMAPDLTNRFFDVAVIQKAGSTLLVDGLSALLQAGTSLLLLAFYHPALLAFDLVLLVCIAFVLFGLGRGGVQTAIKESKVKHQTGVWLQQMASAPLAFKAPPAGDFAFSRADALAKSYVQARSKHFAVLLRQIVASHALSAVAMAALLGLGGALVIRGQLTLGQLVAAELAVSSVLAGVAKSSKSLESYYDLSAALDKLGTLIDMPQERQSGPSAAIRREGAPRVALTGVSFEGEYGAPPLVDVSAWASQDDWLAVLGDDIDGRGTLVSLLYGVRTPRSGRIEFDGSDIRNASLQELRATVVLVDRALLFEGTVADNLHWGRPALDAARTAEVLALLDLTDPLAGLPQGLATRISHNEHPFTADQSLRLTLARGLLCEPRVLLLDGILDVLGQLGAQQITTRLRAVCPEVAVIAFTRRADIAALFGRVQRLTRGVLEGSRQAA